MNIKQINISHVLDSSWTIAKKPIWLMALVLCLSSSLLNKITDIFIPNETLNYIKESGNIDALFNILDDFSIAILLITLLQSAILLGVVNMALEHGKGNNTFRLSDAYRRPIGDYLRFLGVTILYSLITTFGYCLFVLPGILFAVRFLFAPFYILEHPKASIIDALRASWKMTQGNFLSLLLLGLIASALIVVGAFLLYLPMFIAQAYSYFMQTVVYRQLSSDNA